MGNGGEEGPCNGEARKYSSVMFRGNSMWKPLTMEEVDLCKIQKVFLGGCSDITFKI